MCPEQGEPCGKVKLGLEWEALAVVGLSSKRVSNKTCLLQSQVVPGSKGQLGRSVEGGYVQGARPRQLPATRKEASVSPVLGQNGGGSDCQS